MFRSARLGRRRVACDNRLSSSHTEIAPASKASSHSANAEPDDTDSFSASLGGMDARSMRNSANKGTTEKQEG